MFYAEYLGTRIFSAIAGKANITGLQFNQNGLIPVSVQATTGSVGATAQDMTGWTASCAIVGAPGSTEGQDPGSPLAAYQNALALQGDNETFVGTLNCNTPQMQALLTSNPKSKTVFAIKFIKADLSQVFEVQVACFVLAAAIRTDAAVDASVTPVNFTVDAGVAQKTFPFPNLADGSDLIFVKYDSGPAVDVYAINVNPDNPAVNTVTVTLAGVASLGGQRFRAYYLAP